MSRENNMFQYNEITLEVSSQSLNEDHTTSVSRCGMFTFNTDMISDLQMKKK